MKAPLSREFFFLLFNNETFIQKSQLYQEPYLTYTQVVKKIQKPDHPHDIPAVPKLEVMMSTNVFTESEFVF